MHRTAFWKLMTIVYNSFQSIMYQICLTLIEGVQMIQSNTKTNKNHIKFFSLILFNFAIVIIFNKYINSLLTSTIVLGAAKAK